MKPGFLHAGALPVVFSCVFGVSACQGVGSENSSASFAANGSTQPISEANTPHRLSEFREKMVERRDKTLARLKERREQRVASLRQAGVNGDQVKATPLGVTRVDEGRRDSKTGKKSADKPVRIIEIPKSSGAQNSKKTQLAALSALPAAVPVKKPKTSAPIKASVQKPAEKPVSAPKGKFGKLIAKYAEMHGVPYKLARAIVYVESSFRPDVTGQAGEIGLMQIKYETAKLMGYKGSRQGLYDPATNLNWGMKYLGKARKLSDGSTCGTILKYNAGHGATKMNPVSSRYCQRVKKFMS